MMPTCRRIIRSRCCLVIPWAAVRVQDSSLGASWPAEALSSTPIRYRNVNSLLWASGAGCQFWGPGSSQARSLCQGGLAGQQFECPSCGQQ